MKGHQYTRFIALCHGGNEKEQGTPAAAAPERCRRRSGRFFEFQFDERGGDLLKSCSLF
jgi:hypothetical protein